jgi:hypothetical protein
VGLVIAGLDHDAAAGRGSPLPQAEVLEDPLDDRGGLDHGDQRHLAAAAGAHQNVLVPYPAQKIGPRQTPIALGAVGASEVLGRRLRPLLIYGVLDLHELTAGKLAALLARSASRDVFDAHALLVTPDLDPAKLRLGFVVYGGINRKDWRTVSTTDVTADANEVQMELVPMLRAARAPAKRDVAAWAEKLVAECRERLSLVLPLNDQETEFLRRLNDQGEIAPELLTADPAMQVTVREHPGLKWKALNVRRHRGLDGAPGPDEPA